MDFDDKLQATRGVIKDSAEIKRKLSKLMAEKIPETGLVQSHSGRAVTVDDLKDHSTTNLIKRIKYLTK